MQVLETIERLLSDPCNELLSDALTVAHRASDSERRMAIHRIEEFLDDKPPRGGNEAAKVLVALRRVAV